MKPCPVCTHKNLPEINRRLLAGEAATAVAKDNSLAHRAMLNHETLHIPATLRRGAAATQISTAKDLFEELARRYERFGGMELKLEKMLDQITAVCRQFERSKDVVRLIAVLREQRDTIRELRETGRAALEVLKLLAVARGIAEPPEGYHGQPIDVAQAARDLYGLSDLPCLAVDDQRALPPAAVDAAPSGEKEPEPPKPTPEQADGGVAAKDQRMRDSIEAKPATKPARVDRYRERLAQIHAEGRRAEPGELSPRNLGQQVDLSLCEQKAPPARVIGDGQLACPARSCLWSGPGASYATHWKTAHGKTTIN